MSLHRLTASILVRSGLARLARRSRIGQACVLTFHGIREEEKESGCLDLSLHAPLAFFEVMCTHLAANYRVTPLRKVVTALEQGAPLPPRTVAITFDDGYASNYDLAFPVLKRLELPATIFATTGFVDGAEKLWFNRLDYAMSRTTQRFLHTKIAGEDLHHQLDLPGERVRALNGLLRAVKRLPTKTANETVHELENYLSAGAMPNGHEAPLTMRAFTWDQAREMNRSGLIKIEAHTHTHPILARCTPDQARREVFTCRDRIAAELGSRPELFAYPNGNAKDYDSSTKDLLREAGFRAGFTMKPGFLGDNACIMDLPRHGSPESFTEFEATVSGAFDTFKEMRNNLFRCFAT